MSLSTWSEQKSLTFAYLAKASSSARAICSGSTYNLEVDVLIIKIIQVDISKSDQNLADALTPT